MTMINRTAPEAPPGLALTRSECHLLDQIVKEKTTSYAKEKRLSAYLIKIAQLGGYLARRNDPPPGNIVMWRGMSRLGNPRSGVIEQREKQMVASARPGGEIRCGKERL